MSKKASKKSKNAFIRLMQIDLIPSVPDIVGVYIIVAAILLTLIGYFMFTYLLT